MLIDDFLPKYDFVETHSVTVNATAKTIFETMDEIDLRESSIIRSLLFLRGLPGEHLRLRDLQKSHFEILGKRENEEILIGLAGKFWTLNGKLQKINSENFRDFNEECFAKAVWNFSIDENDDKTRLTTETRIRCLDDESQKSFRFYWTFIQPFSGLIRLEMLKIVKRKVEMNNF